MTFSYSGVFGGYCDQSHRSDSERSCSTSNSGCTSAMLPLPNKLGRLGIILGKITTTYCVGAN